MVKRSDNTLSPIIKWAGGKEKEISYILSNAPDAFENYYEPFVGGGSVYVSFDAQTHYINDKSKELIELYRAISDRNDIFFDRMHGIADAWQNMFDYSCAHSELYDLYIDFRNGRIDKNELAAALEAYVTQNATEFKGLLPKVFLPNSTIFEKEILQNLHRKFGRMKQLEAERHMLPDKDVAVNIQTAIMGSLYMYFRWLYNNDDYMNSDKNSATALFVFIRNYAYSGMFRYNDNGDFNVPYGGIGYNRKSLNGKIDYYQSETLLEHFDNTIIDNLDFEDFLRSRRPTEKDFVFLDPPYDSEFSTYDRNPFTADDQRRLAEYLCTECKAKWMMIIKSTPFIRSLYDRRGLNITSFEKKYIVSFMNRNLRNAEHLIIRNYE